VGWIENFSLFMRSSIGVLREKIEEPERMVHQLLIDMEEELERVRDGVAAAIADEIGLRKKAEAAREDEARWMERAKTALERGDEPGSALALEQKVLASERAARLEGEHARQKEETARLERSVQDLEEKIRQAHQKETLLLARLTRAESTDTIHRALERSGGKSAFAQLRRLEGKVERAEALDEAHRRLEGRDPSAEELRRKFEESERKEKLRSEMEDLKRRVHGK
jgi:phage shock protein A